MNKWWQQDIEASISETESTNWGWLHENWYRFQDLATFLSLFFSFIPQSNQHENSQLCREGTRSRLPISHFGSEPHGVEDQEREKVMILRRENRTRGWKQLEAPEQPWMTCVLTYQNQRQREWVCMAPPSSRLQLNTVKSELLAFLSLHISLCNTLIKKKNLHEMPPWTSY